MAYTVNHKDPANGQIIVNDGTLNTSTSLTLVGKNFYGYGEHIEGRVQEVEKTKLPDEVKVGMVLEAQSESGSVILSIKEIKEYVVVLDTNHPLSGKKLIFNLDVVEVTNE